MARTIVTAIVRDQSGRQLQESNPVVFTVRQESVANPPTGPSRPQPPKPQPRGNKMSAAQPSYGALNGAAPTDRPGDQPAGRQEARAETRQALTTAAGTAGTRGC